MSTTAGKVIDFEIRKFRKKPVVVEAAQITAESCAGIGAWVNPDHIHDPDGRGGCGEHGITIRTMEGTMIALPGDWVIRGVNGEFYPCKPHIFEMTYEPVDRS